MLTIYTLFRTKTAQKPRPLVYAGCNGEYGTPAAPSGLEVRILPEAIAV